MLTRRALLTSLLVLPACSAADLAPSLHGPTTDVPWPAQGQASLVLGGRLLSSPGQRPVPVASVAKVMTALVVADRLPASARVVVTPADVEDTARRRARGESVVPVAAGEVLTRDAALGALLVPSANNVAAMLAARVAGSQGAFVGLMEATARDLGLTSTTYTDPSGFAPSTVSTARDQVLVLQAALRVPVLARTLGLRSVVLPVAGRVPTTVGLLGREGVVAGKTGSTSAAGGCLAFRAVRDGQVLDAVVLGQRGGSLVEAGLAAGAALVRSVLPRRTVGLRLPQEHS